MSILGTLLIAIAVVDLCRRPKSVAWLPLVAGPVVVVVLGLLAGLGSPADIALLVLVAVISVGWTVLVGRCHNRGTAAAWPLSVLLVGICAVVLLGGLAGRAAGPMAGWLANSGWQELSAVTADRFLLVLGLFGFQLSTGNEVVRQVLATVGAIKPHGQPQASDHLRGGRLLGPMERVVIFGLGLAGQLTAAGLVIAAKSLIRFPELNARRSRDSSVTGIGIDEVTEYFLVGSFVSWLIALAALGVAGL